MIAAAPRVLVVALRVVAAVTLDGRLHTAASREGFVVLEPPAE